MPSGGRRGSLAPRRPLTTGTTISGFDGPDQDPTRRIDPPPSGSGARREFPTGHAEPYQTPADDPYVEQYESGYPPEDVEEEAPRRGRDLAFALVGLILGIILTFIIVALNTGSDDGAALDEEARAAQEAELAERDARIDELEARTTDLEAQLEAAGTEADSELAAQREALDERLAALDERVAELDERQAALDQRQSSLEEREAALEEAESGTGTTPPPEPAPEDDGGGGVDLDDLEDTAESIVERIMEQIRDLFGQN